MTHEYKLNYRNVVTQEQMQKLRDILDNPVSQKKINAVTDMLSDNDVNEAWIAYQTLPQYMGVASITGYANILVVRNHAWNRYVQARNHYFKNKQN